MSLIHWWPLDGNMKDSIGGNDLVAADTQGTNTVTNDGKIGSTYTNTSNSYGSFVSKKTFLLPQTQSMFCWLYMTSVYSSSSLNAVCGQHRHATNSGMGITVKYKDASTGYISVNTGNGSERTYNKYCGSTELKTNKWYHVGYTYDGSTIKLYVNGKLDGTHSYSGQKLYAEPFGAYMWSFDSSVPGECAPYTAYCPQGKINDIRIYDHTLSDAEVRELSKGLMIHYSFNDTMAEGTTNLLPASLQNRYVENSSDAMGYSITTGLVNGATYTLRTNIKVGVNDNSPNPYLSLIVLYSDNSDDRMTTQTALDGANLTSTRDNQFHPYEVRVKANAAKTIKEVKGWLLDRGTYSNQARYMTVQSAQLEIKDHATPYTPSTRTAVIYNETGFVQPTESTNINLTTDTAFGSYSLDCTGATHITAPSVGDLSQGATASIWIKGASTSSNWVAFADYNSRLAFGAYSGSFIMSCGGTSTTKINIPSNWKASDWNHIVVRKNTAGKFQCFINGAEATYQTGTDNWTHSSSLVVASRLSGSDYGWPITGKIADFRMYMTALSDEEINRLYKVKTYISNEGDLCTGKFVENQASVLVSNKGVINCKEFWEEFDSAYQRLEYIQSDTQAYINTGFSSSGPYQIDCDMEATSAKSNYWFGQQQNSGGMMYNGLYSTKLEFNWLTITPESSLRRTMTQRLVGDGSNVDITINGVTYNVATGTNGAGGDFYIFACRTNAGAFRPYAESIKLYSFRIHDNWADVRNFIPVKRKSDGSVGLYDLVTKSFYANAGSGSFTAGPPKTTGATLIFDNKEIAARNIIEV